jgi:hypothetical protein
MLQSARTFVIATGQPATTETTHQVAQATQVAKATVHQG